MARVRWKALSAVLVFGVLLVAYVAAPVVASPVVAVKTFGPKQGKAGMPVNIVGEGFNEFKPGSVVVEFGGIPGASTEVRNDHLIRTVVPEGLAGGVVPLMLRGLIEGDLIYADVIGDFKVRL